MRRGDLVTVSAPGDYGKPRPAVVVQSDALGETDSVLVCLATTSMREIPFYRLPVVAAPATGLRQPSVVMVDKLTMIRRSKCGAVIGRLDLETMRILNRMISLVTGLADAL